MKKDDIHYENAKRFMALQVDELARKIEAAKEAYNHALQRVVGENVNLTDEQQEELLAQFDLEKEAKNG